MSKQPKAPGTPSTPSKLPKFLQKGRDRSRSDAFATTSSVNANSIRDSASPEPSASASASASSSRVVSNPPPTHVAAAPSTSPPIPIPITPRKQQPSIPSLDVPNDADDSFVHDDEDDFSNITSSPVVIEPTPRPNSARIRADRAQPSLSMYGSPSSSGKIAELPNRLSGWISHAFGGSSNDLSLPNILASSAPSPSSPRAGGKTNPLLVAAKNGKGHLDKAMRYLLDSDATPDNATESIWLLGSLHSATPPSPALSLNRTSNDTGSSGSGGGRTSRTSKLRGGSSDSLAPLPTPLSHATAVQLLTHGSNGANAKHPGQHWPRDFYADFSTRIWCTYRTAFQPIRDSALSALESEIGGAVQAQSPTRRNWWGGEKGWTADTGWGCMLRTGQSLLANALLHLHLGREWRVPAYPEHTPEFATYVRLLTWFFDTPAPQAPFSVHRMALAGKELGKDVGQWFGPSTAAGAIKTLVTMFPACGLGVAVAADSVIYESDVFSASHGPDEARSPRKYRTKTWGGNAVLVLIGLRLGLDGVNPIYYDTIKILYTFPQSVGIAGGRPSSSYYFVGSQRDNLFYLDPHHARPTVPLRPVPPRAGSPSAMSAFDARPGTIPTEVEDPAAAESNAQSSGKKSKKKSDKEKEKDRGSALGGRRSPLSPTSTLSSGSGRSVFSGRSAAGPMGHTLSGSSAHSSSSSSPGHIRWQTEALPPSIHHLRGGSASPMGTPPPPGSDLTPEQAHMCSAYSATELRTFHCERVRKMHLSGLDPSMLVGFLCRDERDWRDLRERVNDLKKAHKPIFSIQDEPPAWAGGGVDADDDSFMGLESFSEDDPEDGSGENDGDGDGDGEVDEDNEDDELFADARGSLRSESRSPSTSPDLPSDSASSKGGRKGTAFAHPGAGQGMDMPSPPAEGDFAGEDDPRTPGPGRAFPPMQMSSDDQRESDDIEDDWEVPGVPTPGASNSNSPAGRNAGLRAPDMLRSSSSNSTGSAISAVSARSTLSVASEKSGRSAKSKSPSTTKRKKRREKEASYPFPVAPGAEEQDGMGEDGDEEEARERERCETETPANQGHGASASAGQQVGRTVPMRSAIAKDGGRTQSGGVRGVPFALTAEFV